MEPRSIPCRDVMGRPGTVAVIIRDRQAVVTVPAGEAAHLTGPQLSHLIAVLQAARDELFRVES